MNASIYLDSLRIGKPRDDVKLKAWNFLVHSEEVDNAKVKLEIDLYRSTGVISSFVLTSEDTGALVLEDRIILEELVVLGKRWVSLEASAGLGKLEKNSAVRETKQGGGSPAETLRAYSGHYKEVSDVYDWTQEAMSGARFEVADVWNDFNLKRRPAQTNGKPTEARA